MVHDPLKRVLIVGAGSVGQVYGRHLQLGGAEVRFLVRPQYVDGLQDELPMFRFRGWVRQSVGFRPDGVYGTATEAASGGVDAVLLAIPYSGLKGPWFDALLEEVGDATIISLVPGFEARSWLLERVPEERLVEGMITLVAYPAPMKGQRFGPGMAYWFPPMSPAPFAGAASRVRPVVNLLRRGGQPSRVASTVARTSATATSLLMPLIAALEAAGWSLSRLRQGGLDTACDAGREALGLIQSGCGLKPTLVRHLVRPWILRLFLLVAPLGVPFSLEGFLSVHFTKVGAQTRLFLEEWIALGRTLERPTPALEALQSALQAGEG